MLTKKQASVTRSALRRRVHWQVTVLCAALLSAGSVAPAHAQQAKPQAVTVAMAPAKNSKEAEAALELTRSQQVWVQKGLNALNFDVGAADGIFGPRTRAAIARWQSARGEPPTGYLDAEAAEMLIEVGKGTSPTEAQGDGATPSTTAQSAARETPEAHVETTPPAEPQRLVVVEAALATLKDARSIARRISWEGSRAMLLSVMADAQAGAGDIEGAKRTMSEALSLAQRTGSDWSQGSVLGRIAKAQATAGDVGAARQSITDAMSVAGRIGDFEMRASVLSIIAAAQAAAGDIQGAMATAGRLSNHMHATALGAIAEVQVERGDTEGARRSIARAIPIARRSTDDWMRGVALSGIARAQVAASDIDGARRSVAEGLSVAENLGDAGLRTSMRGFFLEHQTAVGDGQRALSTARQIGQPWALGNVAFGQAAAGDIQGAMSTTRRIGDDFSRAIALIGIAQAQIPADVRQANVAAARANVAAEQAKQAATQTASSGSGATSAASGSASELPGSAGTPLVIRENAYKRCEEARAYFKWELNATAEEVKKRGKTWETRVSHVRQALQGTKFKDQQGCLERVIQDRCPRGGCLGCRVLLDFDNACSYPILWGSCLVEAGPTTLEDVRRTGRSLQNELCDAERTPWIDATEGIPYYKPMWPNKVRRGAGHGCEDDHVFYWAFTCEE